MRVLLIAPNSREPGRVREIPLITPPINLMYLAQAAIDAGHRAKIIDGYASDLDEEQIIDVAWRFLPDAILIPLYSRDLRLVHRLTGSIRARIPDAKIILGGHHATHLSREVLSEYPAVDFILRGEAEVTIAALLDAIEQGGRSYDEIEGLAYRKGRTIVVKPLPCPKKDLDETPIPSRKLIDRRLYYSRLSSRNPLDVIITSRGCPGSCSFCSKLGEGFKRYRMRSTKSVIEELRLIQENGARSVEIYDDAFTVDRKRCMAIIDGIRKESLDFEFRIRTRANFVDRELLTGLRSVNCTTISYGVESGNQRVLDMNGKGLRLRQVEDAFRLTHRLGINTLGFFLVGFPQDTPETIQETVRFAMRLNPKYATFTRIRPFPGTRIYEEAKKDGSLVGRWSPHADEPWVRLPWADRDELERQVSLAYKRYYYRPSYAASFVWDNLMRGNWAQLAYAARYAITNLKGINVEL